MPSRRLPAALAALALAAGLPAPTPASDALEEIVVILRPGASIDALASRYGCVNVAAVPGTSIFKLQTLDADSVLERMRREPALASAARNGRVRRHQTAGFPHGDREPLGSDAPEAPEEVYRRQLTRGALSGLGLEAAGAFALEGAPSVVAVVDTGVDTAHSAFAGRIWRNEAETPNGLDDDANGYVDDVEGYDFVDRDPEASEAEVSGDAVGHGTFVAGLVALAAPNARIMPLRVLDGNGNGTVFWAAEAVEYAAKHGARVVCMSFGAERPNAPALRQAVVSAYTLGVVLVAAAGNDDTEMVPYPASDELVVAVGACRGFDRARFSNRGSEVDVWAPGVNLVSAVPTGDAGSGYARWSGSSFSAAVVAGACADLASALPGLQPEQVFWAFSSYGPSVRDGGVNDRRVDAFAGLAGLLSNEGEFQATWVAPLRSETPRRTVGGSALLTAVGGAGQITISAAGLAPGGRYAIVARTASGEAAIGDARADASGVLTFVCGAPRRERTLGIFLRGRDSGPNARAGFSVEEGAQLYGGLALAPQAPDAGPRGWFAVTALPLGVQSCRIVLPFAGEPVTYAVAVDGAEIARRWFRRAPSGWVEFYFTNHTGAGPPGGIPLPDVLTPVTAAHHIEVFRAQERGPDTLVFAAEVEGLE